MSATDLRYYAVPVTIHAHAPTPEKAVAVVRKALFQDLPDDQWYGIRDVGIIDGGEIAGDPEDVGPSEWGEEADVLSVFPSLRN